jgi:DNA-binding transcriptional LysR family regulator
VVDALQRGEADIGIATEAVDGQPHLETHPCFTWRHVAIAPEGHPVLDLAEPSLADLARWPIITYSPEFTGGSRIEEAFAEAGIEPDYRLRAMDADVIMTYVRLGAGIGVVAEMAVENGAAQGLGVVAGSRGLFAASSSKLALQKGTLLRNYAYRLVEMLAPHLDAEVLSGARRARPAPAPHIVPFAERTDLHFSGLEPASGREAA